MHSLVALRRVYDLKRNYIHVYKENDLFNIFWIFFSSQILTTDFGYDADKSQAALILFVCQH